MPAARATYASTAVPVGGRLRWSRYSQPYQKRLLESWKALGTFLEGYGSTFKLVLESKAKAVDEILEQFIKQKYTEKSRSGLRIAKHAVLLMQIMRPRLKRKLQGSWSAIRSWEEQEPSNYRPPIPVPLLAALICKARLKAETAPDKKGRFLWHCFGTLLMVGFFGLLRPGEIFCLRARDLAVSNSFSLGSEHAVLRIDQPKNARQMGAQQFVEIKHLDSVNWLTWLRSKVSNPDERLWSSTPTRFRKMFSDICLELGIKQLHLSPASLRAGGATRLIDDGAEVGKIRFVGRWTNLRSLEHYVQVARAQQISLTMDPKTVESLKKFLCKYMFLLALPLKFAAQVSPENLVQSQVFDPADSRHVVECARSWGRLDKSLPQSGDRRGQPEGRKVP